MIYKEIQPPVYFSKHIESYWEMNLMPGEMEDFTELLLPNGTFTIIFSNAPICINTQDRTQAKEILPGATFIGQRNSWISFSAVKNSVRIYGIRFKPFAFANIIKKPIYLLTDQFLGLEKAFELSLLSRKYIQEILVCPESFYRTELVNTLMLEIFGDSLTIDHNLREQINYILDRKGLIKINSLTSDFGVSKVTLRKHFINKVGLTPKRISGIWRMNYFFHLKESHPEENFTTLGLMAGYYDQAHFIKEFKSLMGLAPGQFFKQKCQHINISQENISRRFSNHYDPRN